MIVLASCRQSSTGCIVSFEQYFDHDPLALGRMHGWLVGGFSKVITEELFGGSDLDRGRLHHAQFSLDHIWRADPICSGYFYFRIYTLEFELVDNLAESTVFHSK